MTDLNMPRRRFIKQLGLTASAAVVADPLLTYAQDSSSQVILALVGCGHIHTPDFVKLLKTAKNVKVKYVWDHDSSRAAKHAAELGGQAVNDPAVIWSDSAIKGVVICSETNRHHDLVLTAAEAGKHMFVEKPMGITARESLAMTAAIEKQHLLFTTGYSTRTKPQVLFLKQQVEEGSFGKITRIRGSNCHAGSLDGWFNTEWRWMADPKIAGCGGFGDLGTHSLDIMMWLMGDVAAVTADIKTVTNRYGECDESGEALLKFKNGVTGTLAAGWVDVENPVSLLISGTEGHAVIVKDELYFRSKKVEEANGKEPWTKLPPAAPLPLNQFISAVAGQSGMPLVTPREAAARVVVMGAIYKSARKTEWVRI